MSVRNPTDYVFLVLGITRSANFDCLKNSHLHISSTLDGKCLVADITLGTSMPVFTEHFTWRLTDQHLRRLQKMKSEIHIEIMLEESGKRWTVGTDNLSVKHAQCNITSRLLESRRISVDMAKSSLGTSFLPELTATLTIRTTPPLDRHSHLGYFSELKTKSILRKDTAKPSTSSSAQEEEQECVDTDNTKKSKNVTFRK